ncbi:hypothetical protein V499_07065 [Pseudogymnoascus sp. VKM F-103]|nr:hypothetical protein V499_07065 [Pseudogymnoascus sp. VKM F-103]
MSRKAVGLAAFDRSRLTSAQFASHGSNLRTTHASSLSTQLSVFRSLLQQFAQTHAKDIRSNPTFRAEFGRMCAAIGVDPLASSSGGGKEGGSLWSQLLGGSVNDFYFELAVRVVEVCGQTREENGGMIPVKECRQRIMKGRMEGAPEITDDDILRAVLSLTPLGSSYSTPKIGSKQYIRSVPKELNTDQSDVLSAAQIMGYVTLSTLVLNLKWSRARAKTAIDDLVAEKQFPIPAQRERQESPPPPWCVQLSTKVVRDQKTRGRKHIAVRRHGRNRVVKARAEVMKAETTTQQQQVYDATPPPKRQELGDDVAP